MLIGDIRWVSVQNLADRQLVSRTSDDRPRTLPFAAYQGQDFSALLKGMDQSSEDPSPKFYKGYGVDVYLNRIRDARVFFGTGVDGVVVSPDGSVVAEPSCFHQPAFLAKAMSQIGEEAVTGRVPRAFLACDAAWYNYYHWICYGLAKAKMAESFLDDDVVNIVPVYEARASGLPIAYKETVFNDSISFFDFRLPVARLPEGLYRVDELYFLSTEPRLPPDILISKSFKAVFEGLGRKIPVSDGSPKNMFISRRLAASRRMDSDLEERLFQVARKYDFERVILEEYSFNDQVTAFKNARNFISPHGASFANLLFSPPGTGVLELNHDMDGQGSLRACFYLMAEVNGLRYGFIDSGTDSLEDRLDEAIRRLLSTEGSN